MERVVDPTPRVRIPGLASCLGPGDSVVSGHIAKAEPPAPQQLAKVDLVIEVR